MRQILRRVSLAVNVTFSNSAKMEAAPSSIAVLGAGVIGLAAGIQLLKECPNVSITVFADLTGSETTSQGSGGLWMPYTLGLLQYT